MAVSLALARERGANRGLREETSDSRECQNEPTLFLNRYGEPLGDRGVRKLVGRHAQALGLTKKVTPHPLRHTYANAKARQMVTVYELQQLMRRRFIGTTQKYINEANFDLATVQEATSL
ncbi:MAG: tyrosine-type recombinase/integrase [Dehalococcoidia bacterium]